MANTSKIVRRMQKMATEPNTVLSGVARDVGFAIAEGDREALEAIGRELAARAPHGDSDEQTYWAGFAAGMGSLMAAFQAAHDRTDARAAAIGATRTEIARSIVATLAVGPATGAELAQQLGVTPSAISKSLTALRNSGVARVLGGGPYPKRGARKPHALTSLGSWVADEVAGGEARILMGTRSS
jgi:DNA-binding transcriptional ArsR family regulator